MTPTSPLPPEILTAIFLYLEGRELRSCQLVCRNFNELIESLLELQFQTALRDAGYVGSLHSRPNISIGEKLSTLKNHLQSWNDVSPSAVNSFYLYGTYNGHGLAHGDIEPLFFNGILARWSTSSYDVRLPLDLSIVQLPSPNKGLAFKEWEITEHTIEVDDYWLEPNYDLLILLSIHQQAHNTTSYRFHLRTLSTNEPHPSTNTQTGPLRLELSSGHSIESYSLQIVGRLMFVHLVDKSETGRVYCWDWGTGELQMDQTTGLGATMDIIFLSETMLAVLRSNFADASEGETIGVLDVYSLSSTTSGLQMIPIITLQLPIFHLASWPPVHGPGYNDISRVEMKCYIDPVRQISSFQMANSGTRGSIFELADTNRILLVHFSFINHARESNALSFLLVPVWSIINEVHKLSGLSGSTDPRPYYEVPWETWGANTRWIHRFTLTESFFDEDPGKYLTSGARVLLPRCTPFHNPSQVMCAHEPSHYLVIDTLDFLPSSVQVAQAGARTTLQIDGATLSHQTYCSGSDNLTPNTAGIDEWMNGAELAVAPCVKSKLCHTLFDRATAGAEHLKVWADEEHLVFLGVRKQLR
ncbi:hypothetical protein FRC12_012324 [Ceratobasidium sp. 428]|nr:hypothetical protein FRC12_012324 [Ceratobasidium sp. 428]